MNRFFKDIIYYAAYFAAILVLALLAVFLVFAALMLACITFTAFAPEPLVIVLLVIGAAVFGWSISAVGEKAYNRKEDRAKGQRVVLREIDRHSAERGATMVYYVGKIHKRS